MPGWLVVNADDLGVSKGANLGTLQAHQQGIVTSASLAVTTEFYHHAVESCVRTCPNLGIGLHFTLTSGRPASKPADVPLLVNEKGFLRWRFMSLFAAASMGKRDNLMHQIALELEAQLQTLRADGIMPDHIDGERHIHLIPGIFERVVAAARRHGIRFVRAGADISPQSFPIDLAGLSMPTGFARSWLLSGLSRAGQRHLGNGVASTDYVASYFGSGRTHLLDRSALQLSQAAGVTELMVHPGIPEESRGIDVGNSELERYLVLEDRRRELEFCIQARSWVDPSILTNFTRLAAEMRAA